MIIQTIHNMGKMLAWLWTGFCILVGVLAFIGALGAGDEMISLIILDVVVMPMIWMLGCVQLILVMYMTRPQAWTQMPKQSTEA